jgi:hypothetical protein
LGAAVETARTSGRLASRSFIDWNNEEPAMTGFACIINRPGNAPGAHRSAS